MSKSKMIALVVLITFPFGMTAVGNAVAGENYKVRTVYYSTKWEQLSVRSEEKHIIALSESKGAGTNMEGNLFFDGWVVLDMSTADINAKTGLGSGGGYGEWADRDGDKIYYTWEGKRLRGELWASYW